MSNYFMYNEVDQFHFYMMPKTLFENCNYSKDNLSLTSKVIYSFLRDRVELSRMNNWIDEKGRIYLIFTRESIANKLEISVRTVISCFKELNDCDLIEEVAQGRNKPNLIYLKKIDISPPENPCVSRACKICTSRHAKFAPHDMQNLHSSNTNNNHTEKSKTEKKDLAQVPSSQKTFFKIPEKEVVQKKLTAREKALDKIQSANVSGDWSKVTPTDFTHFYIEKHNAIFKGRELVLEFRGSQIATIREGFIQRYDIPKERVCEFMEEVLAVYQNHPKRKDYDYLSFTMLNNNQAMMQDIMRRVDMKLRPVEDKYMSVTERRANNGLKTASETISDDDLF